MSARGRCPRPERRPPVGGARPWVRRPAVAEGAAAYRAGVRGGGVRTVRRHGENGVSDVRLPRGAHARGERRRKHGVVRSLQPWRPREQPMRALQRASGPHSPPPRHHLPTPREPRPDAIPPRRRDFPAGLRRPPPPGRPEPGFFLSSRRRPGGAGWSSGGVPAVRQGCAGCPGTGAAVHPGPEHRGGPPDGKFCHTGIDRPDEHHPHPCSPAVLRLRAGVAHRSRKAGSRMEIARTAALHRLADTAGWPRRPWPIPPSAWPWSAGRPRRPRPGKRQRAARAGAGFRRRRARACPWLW